MPDKNNHKCSWLADQSGVAMVLFALCAAILVGLVALSVDVGHIVLVRTELQTGADACALAGARGFFPNSTGTLAQINPDPVTAQSTANGWIGKNPADNQLLSSLSDVQTGVWNYTTGKMEPWSWPIPLGTFKGPGITVTVKKQGDLNAGPIHHVLATVFGVSTSDAQAQAIAALSGVGSTEPGQANFPGAITEPNAEKADVFSLFPNGSQTGAWQSFFDKSTDWKTLTDILTKGTAPATNVGDPINTTNGVDARVFTAPTVGLLDIFAAHVASGKPWIVVMPVITASTNPGGQTLPIIGYAAFEVIDVKGPPDKIVTFKPVSGNLGGGAGGGGVNLGLWSLEPKLVQ